MRKAREISIGKTRNWTFSDKIYNAFGRLIYFIRQHAELRGLCYSCYWHCRVVVERIRTYVVAFCSLTFIADSFDTCSIGQTWRMSTEFLGLMFSAILIPGMTSSRSLRSLHQPGTECSSALEVSVELKAAWPGHGSSATCRLPVAVEP